MQFTLLTLARDRGYAMPKGSDVNLGDRISNFVVGSVTITPIASSAFVGAEEATIEGSLNGQIVDDRETRKIG